MSRQFHIETASPSELRVYIRVFLLRENRLTGREILTVPKLRGVVPQLLKNKKELPAQIQYPV